MENTIIGANRGISKTKIIISILLIAGAAVSGYLYFSGKEDSQIAGDEARAKEVQVLEIGGGGEPAVYVEAPGSVRAETKVDVPALAGGTVRGIYFNVGDTVEKNQLLAAVYDSTVLANLNAAKTNVSNMRNNLLSVQRLADENIVQAEIGVESAAERVETALIALRTAQDNLENAETLRDKNGLDLKTGSVNSFYAHLNTMLPALEQIDVILKVDGDFQLPGIENSLGAKDPSSIQRAVSAYRLAKSTYDSLNGLNPSAASIVQDIDSMVKGLGLTKTAIDSVIEVLDNTVTGTDFPESALAAQKNGFIASRANIVGAKTAAESASQALENIDLQANIEIKGLQNAVSAAENQLAIARTAEKTAKTALKSATEAKTQQILAAKTSLDSAQGQYNIVATQAADLTVKAPISGRITAKNVDIGTQASPGQKVAEIAQMDLLVIDLELPFDKAAGISQGQRAFINPENGNYEGAVNKVFPAADPVTKKIRVEVVYDNRNKTLIAGSFADVRIPQTEEDKTGIFLIPLKAVTITPSEKYAYIADQGKARKVTVETGETENEMIQVIGGLEPGMQVITSGSKSLNEGDEIVVNTDL